MASLPVSASMLVEQVSAGTETEAAQYRITQTIDPESFKQSVKGQIRRLTDIASQGAVSTRKESPAPQLEVPSIIFDCLVDKRSGEPRTVEVKQDTRMANRQIYSRTVHTVVREN